MLYILQAGWFKGYQDTSPQQKEKKRYSSQYKVGPEPIVINGVISPL